MPSIPTVESITPDWLTERLHQSGYPAVTVTRFATAQIGTGQIGKCVRFALELEGDDPAAPRSLIGKFPSDDPGSRSTGVMLNNYLKEVSFYRELQSRVAIDTPRCYYADIVAAGPEFALLLEDMSPAQQGDQLKGCSEHVARAAVLQLVGLHAPGWCDESLRGLAWLGEASAESAALTQALYQAQLPGFMDRYGARLAPDEAAIIERVAERAGAFRAMGGVYSLVHVDYRLDNMLIDDSVTPPRVSVVDWQSITLGNPLSDVAYFLGAGLLPDDRRRVESGLVADYHRALLDAGVGGYDWERCWADYRHGAFAGFGVTVIASMLVQQTARGDEMFVAMARRHSRHALDVGAEEYLG